MSDLVNGALATAIAAIEIQMALAAGAEAGAAALVPGLPALPSLPVAAGLGTIDTLPVKQEASLSVTINGNPIPSTDLEEISEVVVKQDVAAPSSFTLRFKGDDALTLADRSDYDLGKLVTVSLGYTSLSPVIMGEITGLEIDMTGGEVPSLVVRGCDMRHRLLRGTRTDSYPLAADSVIAAKIAQRNGLVFVGKPTTPVYDLVIQHEQTDFDFLRERAARIGYEVVADGANLDFRPRPLGSSGTLTLSMDGDVTEFYARMSDVSLPKEVHVRGWDTTQKQAIDAVAAAADLTSMGGTLGANVAADAFPLPTLPGTVIQVNQPVFTPDEAKAMALGQFQDMALGFISGEGTCIGNAGIKAGITLALQKLGNRFGGTYYVMSAEHTYTREQGYRTKFMVRRNATQMSSLAVSLPTVPTVPLAPPLDLSAVAGPPGGPTF